MKLDSLLFLSNRWSGCVIISCIASGMHAFDDEHLLSLINLILKSQLELGALYSVIRQQQIDSNNATAISK